MKAFFYPEYTMAGYAARALGRPVKWTGERGESFLSDTMGRDHVTVAQVAFDADHRIQALKVDLDRQHGRLLLRLRALHPDRRGPQGAARASTT